MILLVYFVASFTCTLQYDVPQDKRETAGSLDIINTDRAIHTDIKLDDSKVLQDKVQTADPVVNDQPIHTDNKMCTKTKSNRPSSIESGTVFKVTPPKISLLRDLSLRKSFPLARTLDILRGVNRVALLATIVTVATIELYAILRNMYDHVYEYFAK